MTFEQDKVITHHFLAFIARDSMLIELCCCCSTGHLLLGVLRRRQRPVALVAAPPPADGLPRGQRRHARHSSRGQGLFGQGQEVDQEGHQQEGRLNIIIKFKIRFVLMLSMLLPRRVLQHSEPTNK